MTTTCARGRPLERLVCSLLLCLMLALAAPYAIAQEPQGGAEDEATERADAAALQRQQQADAALRERLQARLAVIPGLEKARVGVSGEVVTLTGEAADDARRRLAATIAEQAEGVVLVENELGVDTNVIVRTQPVLTRIADSARDLVAALPLLLIAALIVYMAWRSGRWLACQPFVLRRMSGNPFFGMLAGQIVKGGALLAGVVIALDLLDATALAGALLGTAGIVGIAVGFAFRDVAENYIAGLLLSLRQPFAPHDHVVIDGHEGKVAALTLRATILITLEGNHLRLPNAMVFKGVMLNYTRNPTRSFSFPLRIQNWASISVARQIILETLARMDALLENPGPSVIVREVGESSTVLSATAWVDQRATNFDAARSEAIRLARCALVAAGVDLPDAIQAVALERPVAPQRRRDEARAEEPPQAEEVTDLSPDEHIDRQIDQEFAVRGEANLLDPGSPRE